jgi:DNA-binding NtrC family response regulator
MVKEGEFREDLYHRINGFPIRIPPLRECPEDIALLTEHFVDVYRNRLGHPLAGMSQRAMEVMSAYVWPGNIRELKNCIERAAILAGEEVIGPEHLNINTAKATTGTVHASTGIRFDIELPAGEVSLDGIIDRALAIALERSGNNKTLAAEYLNIDRKMFYRRKPS